MKQRGKARRKEEGRQEDSKGGERERESKGKGRRERREGKQRHCGEAKDDREETKQSGRGKGSVQGKINVRGEKGQFRRKGGEGKARWKEEQRETENEPQAP